MVAVETPCPYRPADVTRLVERDREVVRCPFPLYEVLRDEEPVYFNERLSAWVITRHDDIVEVLRDTETYSSAASSGASSVTGLAREIADDPAQPDELRRQAKRRLQLSESRVLLFTDPPLHKRQRTLVSAAFHPRRVAQQEPEIRELADSLIDAFIDRPEVELVTDFSIHLPMTVIARLLGVPPELMTTFKRWSNAFTAGVGALGQSPDAYAEIFSAVDEFYDYFTNELELRRTEPRDDLLSDLVAARLDGEEPLSLAEMLQMLVQFLVAGNETTTNMITTIALRLATDPELQARVRADTTLIKVLVEEMLRLESPVQGLFRTATRDTELAGQQIPAGAMVWLVYASANRDSAVFESPDTVVLDEDRPPHLAFSRGEHFCLGANLARLELKVALEALLDRFTDFTYTGDPDSVDYHASFILRGVARLPLQMTGRVR